MPGAELLDSAAGSGTGIATAATTTTAATYTTAGMIANAGFTSLATQAAISLVNNKGDIGKTLNDLGSSNTVKQVVASMLTAGVMDEFKGNYGINRLAAETATGCATGELTGSGCDKGATQAFVMGSLEWGSHDLRENQIADSEKFKGICDSSGHNCDLSNVSGLSGGVDGDKIKIGGGRINVKDICDAVPDICTENKTAIDSRFIRDGQIWLPSGVVMQNGLPLSIDNLVKALPTSPLGGLQGGQGQLGLFGFKFNYAPGSFADKVVESFAGPHDFLNSSHYYGVDGNISNASGIWGMEFWNSVDVGLAMPLGLSTLCTQSPGLCSSMQNAYNNSKMNYSTTPVLVQPLFSTTTTSGQSDMAN